ncbi:MAG: DUF5615 family PIN-like protein [Methanotrichaceae archaeon]
MSDRRFIADHMLIRMARWLRMAGHDVSNPPLDADDLDLMQIAKEEERTLITRDRDLAKRCRRDGVDCILVASSALDDQLREMILLGIDLEMRPERCTICNGPLREMTNPEPIEVANLAEDEPLRRCESCGKLYWKGSHWARIKERLERLREG